VRFYRWAVICDNIVLEVGGKEEGRPLNRWTVVVRGKLDKRKDRRGMNDVQ
jgi:hypothetical protein